MKFGEWLKKKRTDRGYSQERLADLVQEVTDNAVKCTGSNISGYEREYDKKINGDPVTPKLEMVDALAVALGVPLSEARIAAGYAPPNESFSSLAAQRAAEYIEGTQKGKREDALAFLEFWRQRYPLTVASSGSGKKGKPHEVDKPVSGGKMTTPVKDRGSNGEENTGTSD